MRRIIACFLLFAVCSTFLFSCGEPPLGEDELPIDEENSVKIIEYGYDLKRTKEEALIAYRIAFKVPETIDFGKSKYNFEIQLSHGGGGGWFDGGFVYPNIQRIEVVVNDHILCQDEYFDYIDSYFFADKMLYSNGSNYQGKKVELYTTSEYEEWKNKDPEYNYFFPIFWIRFNNEETYVLRFSGDEGTEEYTFQIREVYFDGSVKVACEAKLYARKEGGVLHFSTTPFDE